MEENNQDITYTHGYFHITIIWHPAYGFVYGFNEMWNKSNRLRSDKIFNQTSSEFQNLYCNMN